MPFHVGPVELILLFALILIIFGVGRLPEVGGAMGKAIRGFRRSVAGEDESPDPGAKASQKGARPGNLRIIE